jgi:hypothetical protein
MTAAGAFAIGAVHDPRQVPELRQGLLALAQGHGRWYMTELERNLQMISTVIDGADLNQPDRQTMTLVGVAADRAANSIAWSRRTLTDAHLFYVSPELAQVAFAAADSIPVDHTLSMGDLPAPCGLIVFGEPFFGIDAASVLSSSIRVDAVMWGPVNLPPADSPWEPAPMMGEGRRGIGLSCFRLLDLDNHDDPMAVHTRIAMAEDEMFPASWLPQGRSDWLVGHPVNDLIHNGVRPDTPQQASMEEDRRLMASVWALIQQHRVVERHEVTAARPAQRRITRAGGTPAPVQVIHLRSPEHRPHHGDGSTGRKIGVRFVVRPHWRNQACGPGRTDRRLILVPPHVKGPIDAPLVHTERVWSLDR